MLALALVMHGLGCERPTPRPNVVLYVIDTLRADGLEPYGNPVVATPHIARLAREGILFERAYAPSSWTRPSVTSMLTGLAPDVHGIKTRDDAASENLSFVAETFRAHGYRTAAIVTNPNVASYYGFDQGWDDFVELFPSDSSTGRPERGGRAASDHVTRRAADWIDASSQPFFLFVLTTDPHHPYEPPTVFDHYAPSDAARTRSPLSVNPRRRARMDLWRSKYFGEIAFNDDSLGQLIDHIEDRDLLDHTAIVLAADHGEEFGEHGDAGHGRGLFEETLRVPLIVLRPGEPEPGRRVEQPVPLQDVHPTLLGLAGLPIPQGLDGRDLLALGERVAEPIHAVLDVDGFEGEMLLAPPWKLIVDRGGDRPLRAGLFDIEADPLERENRAVTESTRKRSLEAVMQTRAARNQLRAESLAGRVALPSSEGDVAMPEDVRAGLEALGYLDPTTGPDAADVPP
jgi:choline-sulfatase